MRTILASLICAAPLIAALAFGAWSLGVGIEPVDWLAVWPIVAGYLEHCAERS